MDKDHIRIGEVDLSLDEAEETLSAIRHGKIDAVVVEGASGDEIYTFRDPGLPYRLLVETMGEGAALTTLDGVICYENPAFEQLVGARDSTSIGRSLSELVVPFARREVEALLERGRTGNATRAEVELVGRLGQSVSVQLSLQRASLADVAVFCMVVTDLSEHKRQEGLYRTARLEIEARDRLFSVAAHELRSPLAVLELQTQLLAKRLRAGDLAVDAGLEMVESLHQQGRRLTQLVSKLLDVGSIGAGRLTLAREPVDLAGLTRNVLQRASRIIERSGSRVSTDLEPVKGEWDRVRIEQVVDNLVSNAVKFGRGMPIRVVVERQGEWARIGVEDHGKGIPEEARELIFRPYERVAETVGSPGMGLGLYITAEIVKAHGGSIRVEGVPGGGSRFLVDLPLR